MGSGSVLSTRCGVTEREDAIDEARMEASGRTGNRKSQMDLMTA